jgi:hypothetical protein
MAKLTYNAETAASPEAVIAAARDFTDRRPDLWPQLDRSYYEVHEVGEGHAVITEGTESMGGIWARERYEWPEPDLVRASVQDSNVFRSGVWELRARPRPGGGAHVEVLNHRRARGIRGHLLGAMLQLAGRRMLAASLEEALERVEKVTYVDPTAQLGAESTPLAR